MDSLLPTGPIAYFPNRFQWGNETLNRLTRRRTTVFGGLLRHQANFLDNRRILRLVRAIDGVRQPLADRRAVGRDRHDAELINLKQLSGGV